MPTPTDALLTTAETIVSRNGVGALTMDSLALAAGVSRATLYRQLGSRQELLKRLAARGLDIGDRGNIAERILAAATEVFLRHGMEAGTIEAIAEAAKVGPATVYRHFGDKRGLMEAFLAAQTPRRTGWELARQPSGDLRGDLLYLARTLLTFMTEHSGLLHLALRERARGDGILSTLSRSPDRTIHACAALLGHYVERGELAPQEPLVLARVFMGTLFGFGLFQPLLGIPGDCDVERDAPRAVQLFLDGALAHKPLAQRARRGAAGRKS